MSIIHTLDSLVIDQIAAGEVIERPASVVKELLENALDAHSSHVTITLLKGGLESICIEDNGIGMSSEDLRKCILRHATSKLKTADDLVAIQTLGFRGEALASIASVSRMTLTSRRAEDAVGTRLVIEAGRILKCEEIGCPKGTVITVEDIFFNTPARRKFLRSVATEQAYAVESSLRVILGAENAGIVVQTPERRLLDVAPHGELKNRIRMALGERFNAAKYFYHEYQGVSVYGFIGNTTFERSDSKQFMFYVNRRFVRDRMLQKAALESLQRTGESCPSLLMYLDIKGDAVDVNVHPQKSEVRFSEPGLIFKAISEALSTAFTEHMSVEQVRDFVLKNKPSAQPLQTSLLFKPQEIKPLSVKPIQQLFNRFLLCEKNHGFSLLDLIVVQKNLIVHQRFSYQPEALLFPVTVDLQPLFQQYLDTLLKLGFLLEEMGKNRFIVRSAFKCWHQVDIPHSVSYCVEQLVLGVPIDTLFLALLDKIETLVYPLEELLENLDGTPQKFGKAELQLSPENLKAMFKLSTDDPKTLHITG